MKRILLATALCAAFAGSAFAQTATDAATDSQGNSPIMMDRELVGGFYTDDTMTEMRSVDEMRSAYGALTEEQRETLRTQCEEEENRGTEGTALCSQIMTF
ncbi:hypothetical protein [Neoaquamicrobium sediminum]|uniref:LTXXQ motif family protein n=1 Tax=Neoaquamicrobium sediminum TaxID=1849104 RepID=A0ABV3WZW1_9HYPH